MILFLITSTWQILSLIILKSFFFAYFSRVLITGVVIGLVLSAGGGEGLVEGVCLLEVGNIASVIDLAIANPTPAPTVTTGITLQT